MFHSEYMVKVVDFNSEIGVRDLIAFERVAALSKKIGRLGYVNETGEVEFVQVEHFVFKK